MEQRLGPREQFVLARHLHGADVANVAVQIRFHLFPKVFLVLDDSRNQQWQATQAGDRNRKIDAFIGVNSPEENEFFAGDS